MKWIKNDVTFRRGNYRQLIARLDDSPFWLQSCACMTTQCFRQDIRKLAQEFGCSTIEVMYRQDADGRETKPEDSIVGFLRQEDGSYWFAQELPVPEGAKRKFREFTAKQIFTH